MAEFDITAFLMGKAVGGGGGGGITILSGSDDPLPSAGVNGQMYLKTGGNLGPGLSADTEYVCNEPGAKLALIDYRNYYKTYSDPAIVIICRADAYWQPHLASLTANGVVLSADSGGPWDYTATYEIDGRIWYFNMGNHGINVNRITSAFPVVDQSFKFESISECEDFLALANVHEVLGSVLDGYVKKAGAWQPLIGTDISDINLGG